MALEEAIEHLEALKRVQNSGISAIEVAGHWRATREQRRRFEKNIHKGANAHSPFLGMVKQIRLPYGQQSSHFTNGQLSTTKPLVHNTFSMEVPFVEFFDPEAIALRRIRASATIKELLQTDADGPEVSNE